MTTIDASPSPAARAATVLERAERARVPLATYRLQFNQGFTFRDAAAIVPYLQALGVSDIYASPYFRARPESSHGYDVTDHNSLNPAIGSEDDYRAFVDTLHAAGMGQTLDVVPNHMGVGSANPWWMDVLENGPAARHAEAFDIDWQPLKPELAGKVLLPILGDQYGVVLEDGQLTLDYHDGAFILRYWEHELPIDPRSYADLLRTRLDALIETLGAEDGAVLELQSIITAATNLPGRDETDPERLEERAREKEIIKRRLDRLWQDTPAVRVTVAETLTAFAGTAGEPRSFDRLDALIDAQAYRLSYWRVAAEEINYRRFFEINELAAVRMEQATVFRESHRLLLRLLGEGALTGVRLDHIDGLWDPAAYTVRLQAAYMLARYGGDVAAEERDAVEEALAAELTRLAADDPADPRTRPLWLVVEKILMPGERLPDPWPVHGTTGYDFTNAVNGLFVDTGNRRAFDDIYTRFSGRSEGFRDLAYESKTLIMETAMASELNVLAYQLSRLAGRNRRTRDYTLGSLTDALREVIAAFPVYRTYVATGDEHLSERDRAHISSAVNRARRRNPAMDASVFEFIRDTLLLAPQSGETEADRTARRNFVMKFQQYTGPVTAKGVEDTAFYRYNRLVSLNEVGGEPDLFGLTPAAFHRQNRERAERRPAGMIATATHDTKRGEDTRARINVLSELPREWRSLLTRWSRANRRRKVQVDGAPAPDRNDEYLLYQILLGAWPLEPLAGEARERFIERIQEYMGKAAREAKLNTSWIAPNDAYDQALRDFVGAILAGDESDPFLRDFLPFQRRVARAGMVNGLAQALLKLTAPGVPDIYQGAELWDLSLVDPDNRRPVDYAARRQALETTLAAAERGRAELAADLLHAWPDGRIKLYVMHRALHLRRRLADVFGRGQYLPLEAEGARREHVFAYARCTAEEMVITVTPRLAARLGRDPDGLPVGDAVWSGARLPLPSGAATRWRDQLTGALLTSAAGDDGRLSLAMADVFAVLPVALLVAERD